MREIDIASAVTPVETAMALLQAAVPFDQIRRRYEEPWRMHHAWHHPSTMFDDLLRAERDGVRIVNPTVCCIFVPWHDVVYYGQATHGVNEKLSAALCRHQLAGLVSTRDLDESTAAILTTIDHRIDTAAGADNALQLDLDLGILGKGPYEYDRYDSGIRTEYAHVEHRTYWTRRREILEGFLKRDRLYLTDWAHDRWNEAARTNLTRSIMKAAKELGE